MLNPGALTLANITWLMAAMGFVIAPHVARLPIWISTVCIAAGAWRWWAARHALRAPPWWLMALIAIGVAAGARLEYGRLLGREVGVALLIVMLCLKVLEMRTKRDAMIAIFLGFFLALTNFLYSQTLLMGAYMLICVWIFVATLIGFNRIGGEVSLRQRTMPAFWLVLQSIPLMLVLFFLFPRLSQPLWRMPGETQASTGLSDEMTPGDISKLSQSEAVAFRVDFESAVPQTEDLYWRGPVLGQQFGRSWRMYPAAIAPKLEYEALSPAINYRVTLQPNNKSWLFALDMPAAAPPGSFFLTDYQLRSATVVSSLRAYDMSSHLRYRTGTQLDAVERTANLQYNRTLNPRTIAYAKKLREENPDPKVMIEKLMARYNSEFEYTLEPPVLGTNNVDDFLFDSKKGFCEHYAGSFVLVLRAAGIPARVVTGYQGGEVNPITRQLVVRQSEAHAWSEVWLDDLGWIRADPTFAVSPLRINRGMSEALGPQGFNVLINADKLGILRQLAFSWDALNSQWNRWVIGFNQDRQRSMLEAFGIVDLNWRDLAIGLIAGVFGVGGIVGLFLILRIHRQRAEPAVMAYRLFCRKLAKVGLQRAPHEGPHDFLARIGQQRPDLQERAALVIDAYVALRYSRADGTSRVADLVSLARRFSTS